MAFSQRINFVIRRSSWDAVLESQFLSDVVLGGLRRPIRYAVFEQDQDFPYQDDMLILNHENRCSELIHRAIAAGCRNVGVVAWSHTRSEDASYYPLVDYVLRPYFKPEHYHLPPSARCAQVEWIPNGYRSGVGPRNPQSLPSFADRTCEIFFAGFPDTNPSERQQMLQVVRSHQLPAQLVETSSFGQGLSIHTYRAAMENARFALIPGGADAETIRLFEALELGAIPICINYPYLADDRAMGSAPVVRILDWDELPARYYQMARASNYLEIMEGFRQHLGRWWLDFKMHQQTKVAQVIDRSFARTYAR